MASGIQYLNDLPIVTLTNANGMLVNISLVGAIIQALVVPDRCNIKENVVLGFNMDELYLNGSSPSFGAVVGRYANRIANHTFSLNGKQYILNSNDGNNTLHGGAFNFGTLLWYPSLPITNTSVTLKHISPDGDNGFPGELRSSVTYTLDNNNTLTARFEATTNKDTVVSLAQHTYWNLGGATSGTILNHNLTVNSAYYTPVDAQAIPTGQVLPVEGTPLDFQESHRIGERIKQMILAPPAGYGYDNNWVLFGNNGTEAKAQNSNGHVSEEVQFAAELLDPVSGRVMELWTNTPGLQVYTGNNLNGSLYAPNGTPYVQYAGVALEQQQFPNAPNQPNFPSTELKPGQVYSNTVQYRLGTDGQQCKQ